MQERQRMIKKEAKNRKNRKILKNQLKYASSYIKLDFELLCKYLGGRNNDFCRRF